MGCNQDDLDATRQGSKLLEDAGKVESFTVVIAKEEGIALGAALDKDRDEEVAIVTSIDVGGYLMTWNKKHPAKEVRLGDRIVAVNDCNGSYWEMVAQLWWRAGECKLTVERGPYNRTTEHRSGSRIYLAEYMSDQMCSKLAYGSPVDHLQVSRAADTSGSQCAVCLEDYEDPEVKVVVLPCNHVFHSACVGRWLCKGSKCCPLCKAIVSDPDTTKEPPNTEIVGETYV
jgi:hypothetical protein